MFHVKHLLFGVAKATETMGETCSLSVRIEEK